MKYFVHNTYLFSLFHLLNIFLSYLMSVLCIEYFEKLFFQQVFKYIFFYIMYFFNTNELYNRQISFIIVTFYIKKILP